MLEILKNADRELLLYLNSKHTLFLDQIMSLVTERFFWIPFYIVIVGFIIWKLRVKGVYAVLFIALLIIAADRISSGVIKPLVKRPRPCHEATLSSSLRAINGCGGPYGFVSSHACNTFALAIFLILIFRRNKWWIYLLLIWATIVSYSRIYLGVHYPGDILAGALLGGLLAIIFYLLYKKFCLHPLISGQRQKS